MTKKFLGGLLALFFLISIATGIYAWKCNQKITELNTTISDMQDEISALNDTLQTASDDFNDFTQITYCFYMENLCLRMKDDATRQFLSATSACLLGEPFEIDEQGISESLTYLEDEFQALQEPPDGCETVYETGEKCFQAYKSLCERTRYYNGTHFSLNNPTQIEYISNDIQELNYRFELFESAIEDV